MSAARLLGFVNLVNREEIRNVITNEYVDFVPLASYLGKLLDALCNETTYVQFLYQCWRQQIISQRNQLMWSAGGLLGL